jgi:hypothetical protein
MQVKKLFLMCLCCVSGFMMGCASQSQQVWVKQVSVSHGAASFNKGDVSWGLDTSQIIFMERMFFGDLLKSSPNQAKDSIAKWLSPQYLARSSWLAEDYRIDETRGFSAKIPIQIALDSNSGRSKYQIWIHDVLLGVDLTREQVYDWRFSNLTRSESDNAQNLSVLMTWSLMNSDRENVESQGVYEIQMPLKNKVSKDGFYNVIAQAKDSILKQAFSVQSKSLLKTAYLPNGYYDSEWIFWTDEYEHPTKWCSILKTEKKEVLPSACRVGGQEMRSQAFIDYVNWLKKNIQFYNNNEYLKTRESTLIGFLNEHEDDYWVVQLKLNDAKTVWAIFHGGKPYPVRILEQADVVDFLKSTAQKMTQVKLNDVQKEASIADPVDFYKSRVSQDHQVGLGYGMNWGFGSHANSPVLAYNAIAGSSSVRDSSSVWNWLKPNSPQYSLYYQYVWSRFLSVGVAFTQSQYSVNYSTDFNPPQYGVISDWTFMRYEPSMFFSMMFPIVETTKFEISPYFSMNYAHTFWSENFEGKQPSTSRRFRMSPDGTHPTGGGLGLGVHLLLNQTAGLKVEGGVNYRSLVADENFDEQSAEVIGSALAEGYLQMSVFWNWRGY